MTEKAFESCLYEEFDDYQSFHGATSDGCCPCSVARPRQKPPRLLAAPARALLLHGSGVHRGERRFCTKSSLQQRCSNPMSLRIEKTAALVAVSLRPSAAFELPQIGSSTKLEELVKSRKRDPITQAYFRELERTSDGSSRRADAPLHREEANREREKAMSNVARLLNDAGIFREESAESTLLAERCSTARSGLSGAGSKTICAAQWRSSPICHVLVAGLWFWSRRFRAVEAAKTVMAICDIGLKQLVSLSGKASSRIKRRPAS